MKRLRSFAILAALIVAPCAAQSQSTATSPSMMGVGTHGYDFLIGTTWSCSNTIPSPIGGPSSTTVSFARSKGGTSVFFRISGKNFDESAYFVYAPKTKTWWNPSVYADGSYGSESSTDTGKKIVWTGTLISPASGRTMQIRDTITMNTTKYIDLGEYKSAGAWKTQYDVTCTKS